jgi:hypothetical protein
MACTTRPHVDCVNNIHSCCYNYHFYSMHDDTVAVQYLSIMMITTTTHCLDNKHMQCQHFNNTPVNNYN